MLNTAALKQIYSSEQVLLVLLSRLYFRSIDKVDVDGFIINENIDWKLLYDIAKVHGIRSFLYVVIKKYSISVNPEFLSSLNKRYLQTRFKNFQQIQFSANLINQCRAKNIDLIPYKGALFAEHYYEDWSARESIDMDFLVSKRDVHLIEDFFIENKYRKIISVPREYLSYYNAFFKDIVYFIPNMRAVVELHWRLMDPFSGSYPSYDYFSKHLIRYQTGSFHLQRLTPTYDFLALVSNHFVKDMGSKFKYLIDVACILSQKGEQIDLDLVFNCAKQYGFNTKLNIGLNQVEKLLGIAVENSNLSDLSQEYLKIPLAYPIKLKRFYIDEREFISYSMKLQDNLYRKIKFLFRCFCYIWLPTYDDINQMRFPVVFLPVLIIARPFRLLYKSVNALRRGKS